MNVKITPFLSSLGMVRCAHGSNDPVNCLGVENPRSGSVVEMIQWKKLCSRIRLTAIFLHLRGTQVVGEQAAYAVGVGLSQFYAWKHGYSECARLWDTDGDPLLASIDPVFDLDQFMPKAPSASELVKKAKKIIFPTPTPPGGPAKKAATKKPMPPREQRAVKTIHELMSRLPIEVRRTIAKHFA